MWRFLTRGATAIAIFAILAVLRVHNHFPVLPNPLTIDLQLDRGEAGRADPLIVGGRTGTGDFLTVRFTGPDTFQFFYDSWGQPGIPSKPVTFRPGEKLRLSVEMPALDQVQGGMFPSSNRLRVICNGSTVFDESVHYFVREPNRLFFGENALGGTACGTTLHGQITTPDGVLLSGRPAAYFSWRERLRDWLRNRPQQVATLLLLSFGLVFYGPRVLSLGPRVQPIVARVMGPHRWFLGSAALATACYLWLVTIGGFRLFYPEVFGSFYDYQAASFLQGRLDVPEDAIGGEAFEARGKLYGYFGPTPALLRIPFVLSGFGFGKLSRLFMVAYFVASLVAAYLILRDAIRSPANGAGRSETAPVPSPFAVIVLVGSVGLGSTLFFLGSRGLIFHEAILAGIAFALWSCWYSLRQLAEPDRSWWIGALICGVLSVHCRPPTGLFALTLLGCITLANAFREWRAKRWTLPQALRKSVGIGALCAIGFLSLNGLAWLKFRTFDAAPLRLSRPYTGQPGRLERVDGKSFHLVNLPFNFDTYVLRPNFRLERSFPWIYLGSKQPRRDFPRAKIDLPDFTLAVPYAMPSLFLLATLGCLGAVVAIPAMRWPVFALWASIMPMTLALLAAIATAQRYTGDFCPFLICAAVLGLAAVERCRPIARAAARSVVAVATLAAIVVTFALTLHYQRETLWGVPEEARWKYQNLRRQIDTFFGQPVTNPPTPPPPRTDVDF